MTFGVKENWLKVDSLYTQEQIEGVINELGIEVYGETDTVFMCYCPFHSNTDTPSFAVNKDNGTYLCFSPICDVRGKFTDLVIKVGGKNIYQARRMIEQYKNLQVPVSQQLEDIFKKKNELVEFPASKINEMADAFWESPALAYMHSRGFQDKTLAYFQVGYSDSQKLVVVPVHDWDGNPVGVIGRTIEGKRFKNSKKIPTHKTLFNIHRAKRHGERVIIVESSMDAMRIHQAGFPYVIATCGGFFTESHVQLIDRYFNEIIIMTDNDKPEDHISVQCKKCPNTCMGHNPGRALGEQIMAKLRNKRFRWAAYDHGVIYPHGAKDAGDLTEEEIAQCINNSINSIEMEWWKKEFPQLAVV